MFKAIGAVTVADRQYRDPRGRTVSLHLAIFAKSEKPQGVPHPPEDCYLRSGWTAGEPKYVSLDQAGATGNVAKFLPVERGGVSAGLMYWYQVEGAAYWNGDRQRSLLLACRGRPVRPPIVKVLLQASATNPGDAEKALASLAQEVYAWTRGFH
jgi:hypothetical protein